MKPLNRFSAAIFVLAALVFCHSAWSDQQTGNTSPSTNPLSIAPAVSHMGEFYLKRTAGDSEAEIRVIRIHRADQSHADVTRPVYFHTPAFVISSATTENSACPLLFKECVVDPRDESTMRILLRVLPITEDTRQMALTKIQQVDASWLAGQGFSPQEIDVRAWPIVSVQAGISWKFDADRYIAVGKNIGTAIDLASGIDIWFAVDKDDFLELRKGIDSGGLKITYKYQFVNVTKERAVREIYVTQSLIDEISRYIDLNNLESVEIIDQKQRNEHIKNLSTQLRSSTVATSADAALNLPAIGDSYVNSMFIQQDVELDKLEQINPELAKNIFEHFKPIIETLNSKNTETYNEEDTNKTTKTVEDKTENTLGAKLQFGGSFSGSSADTSKTDTYTVTDDQLNELKKTYNLQTVVDETTGNIKPTKITFYKFSKGWETKVSKRVDEVRFATGFSEDLVPMSPIPFGKDSLVGEASEAETDYSGVPYVPVGSALCTFASKLPQGFVWADGRASNIFPATEIFPAHLRGKPVPNMNSDNLLVGGTGNEKSVGVVTKSTPLKLPPMIGKNLLGVNTTTSTSQETEVKFISGVKHKVVPGRGPSKWVYFDADWKATTVPSITYVSGLTLTTDPKLFDSQWTTIDRENASPHVQCRWIVRVQ